MARKNKNPADIESEIAALQVQLATAREAEQAHKWNELARLLKRVGALDDALAWARSRTTRPRHEAANHDQ